ncbi:class I SAM-dependent methyltransferase [Rhodospirillales bacterium]|jgi:16S rRNA (guanine1516-N2)-methyltransferase|nr:class I SAM-dependent methyltransferase [Rhodospirillales bacterium]MDC1214581.1 class I SAM-dependent methyltransferase [Rhodospirillales bacterium]
MTRKTTSSSADPLVCDFTGGTVLHRFKYGGGRGQSLPKAVGMRGGKTPKVVDATAGLGRDAFLLASLGAEVTLIERSLEMFNLLNDGISRARDAGGDVAEVIARMTLIHGDAKDLLPDLSPEVVLVDPMHPPRKKSALVKNEMRQIREIVGTDEDSLELMQVALSTASNRVVLKWPLRADPMDGIGPCSHQILGKSTRYDVFMIT